MVDQFRRRLADEVGADAHVGLVLVFGKSRDPFVPTRGTLVSQQFKDLVLPAGLPQPRTMNDMRAYGRGRRGRHGRQRGLAMGRQGFIVELASALDITAHPDAACCY